MLANLSVKNLAIVEAVELAFGAGLNIITGETGAGKSILMGALDLVLGGRADRSAIRDGATEAVVEALFTLADTAALDAVLHEAGLPPCEEGSLLVRRSVAASGAGRSFVNNAAATALTLRRLGELLVDIHGPYDHQSLLSPDFQRDVLDAYGGCAAARRRCAETWRELRALKTTLEALEGEDGAVAAETERLRHTLDEIAQAGLSEADEDELLERHAAAANAGRILELGGEVVAALMDGERPAFDMLAGVQTLLAELARVLPEAGAWRDEAQSIAMQVQELCRAVNDSLSRIEAEPEQLAQLEARMALVQRLKRRYGRTVKDILAKFADDEARLQDLANRGERIEQLGGEIAAAEDKMRQCAATLSAARARAAGRLARSITGELRDLGFERSGFSVDLTACDPGPHGADTVSFGFAPNPGEPMRSLRAIASSGEIARVMLAVKAVLASHDLIPVLVFDEIDANIGGEVGKVVGQKLRRVAGTHQVISITHLPQSAVYGQQHFVITKETRGGRTRMRAAQLRGEARVDEIARMLGGKGETAVVETHARELLDAAARE